MHSSLLRRHRTHLYDGLWPPVKLRASPVRSSLPCRKLRSMLPRQLWWIDLSLWSTGHLSSSALWNAAAWMQSGIRITGIYIQSIGITWLFPALLEASSVRPRTSTQLPSGIDVSSVYSSLWEGVLRSSRDPEECALSLDWNQLWETVWETIALWSSHVYFDLSRWCMSDDLQSTMSGY